MTDPLAPPPALRDGLLPRLSRILAVAGGALMVGLGLLVTVSVVLRWSSARTGIQGVPGDFEIVQMGLALAVFAFLPLCQARRGNIVVDTFTARLPRRAQAALDALWDLVFAGFAALIAWRLVLGALDAMSSRTTSMVLALPVGWAILACAVMAALLALVCLATAAARLRDGA